MRNALLGPMRCVLLLCCVALGTSSSCHRHGEAPVAPTLLQAVKTGRLRTVEKALKRLHNPKETDATGSTALHWAAACFSHTQAGPQILERLLAAGARVDVPDVTGWTPLFWAVRESRNEQALGAAVRVLLRHKANPNWQDASGNTPLHYAVWQQNLPLVAALLQQAANPDVVNSAGESPLFSAFFRGKKEDEPMLRLLLQRSTAVHAWPATETTWLHLAVGAPIGAENQRFPKSLETIRLLLANKGCLVDQRDAEGRTALHHAAAAAEEVAILELLLKAGADPNRVDQAGHVPLWYAQQRQHPGATSILAQRTQKQENIQKSVSSIHALPPK